MGCGTCGLGVGAGSTLEMVQTYLKNKEISADVIETGCIGILGIE